MEIRKDRARKKRNCPHAGIGGIDRATCSGESRPYAAGADDPDSFALLQSPYPAALLALAAGILAAFMLNQAGTGVELVGAIPSGLPSFQMPDLNLLRALLPSALGIALISFIESIAAARTFAEQDDLAFDANQELLALGAANVVRGFFQAYPGARPGSTGIDGRSQIDQIERVPGNQQVPVY